MKLGKERKETYYTYDDTEFTPEEFKLLKEYGLKHIAEDNTALVNYAIVDILRKSIDNIEEKNNIMKAMKTKKAKKGKT